MGKGYVGTRIPDDLAGRLREFEASAYITKQCSKPRRPVLEFGRYVRVDDCNSMGDDCGPDFENAVSTVVVRALPSDRAGAPKYWLRQVCVITLAEVLCNFKDDAPFAEIYDAWLEGAAVIRKRCPRGRRPAGDPPPLKRRRRPERYGSQRRQEGHGGTERRHGGGHGNGRGKSGGGIGKGGKGRK